MRYFVCSIRDRAADVFGQPMFFNAKGSAIRAFSDEVNNPKRDSSQISLHPEDFDLYFFGFFDDSVGSFELLDRPEQLAIGKDQVVVKQ